jgi:hypothetical protein
MLKIKSDTPSVFQLKNKPQAVLITACGFAFIEMLFLRHLNLCWNGNNRLPKNILQFS